MPHLQLYGRDYFAKKKATTEAAFQDLKMIQSIAKTMTRPYVVPSSKGKFTTYTLSVRMRMPLKKAP